MINWLEMRRKLWHAMNGGLLSLLIFITPPIFFQSLAICVMFLLLYVRLLIEKKYETPILCDYLKAIGRKKELSDGAFYFVFGALIASLFFEAKIAAVSVLVLGVSDAVATIFGVHGKYKIYKNKTFEGTLAFFISCFIIVNYFFGFYTALFCALILSPIELLSGFDDNIVIPPVCSLIIAITTILL